MSDSVRFSAPGPGTVKSAALLVAIVLVPGAIAAAIGGSTASLTVGLCAGAAMGFGTLMPPRTAVLVTLGLGFSAALGAAVSGDVWLSSLAVALVVLLTAPANAYSAGMLAMAPILTLVFAVADRGWAWWQAGIWGVVGGLVGLALGAAMKFGQRPPQPISRRLAWRHAAVLAVAVGASLAVAQSIGLDHGYWAAVTLLVVVRPVPDERRPYLVQRLWGTLAGAAVALIVLWLLPPGLLIWAAFVFLVLLAAYAMSGNYFMQTLFLTPMLLLFVTAGSSADVTVDLTLKRLVFTVVGVLLAAGAATGLARWDERSGLVESPRP